MTNQEKSALVCPLCGQKFEGECAHQKKAGHVTHCRRRQENRERIHLLKIAMAARLVVGNRYPRNEMPSNTMLRGLLDEHDRRFQ